MAHINEMLQRNKLKHKGLIYNFNKFPEKKLMTQCKTNAIQKSITIVTNDHTIIHITTKKMRKTMGKKSSPREKICQYTNVIAYPMMFW